jgi:hypothetical protein
MNGQLSLKSEEGTGSCFKLRLKFPLPPEEESNPKQANCGTCDRETSQGRTDPNQVPKPGTGDKKKGIHCRCGDDSFPGPGPGQKDSNCLDVEISLTNGESRSITLAAPHTTADKRTKAIEVSDG